MPLFYFTDAAILKQYDSFNVIESAVLTPAGERPSYEVVGIRDGRPDALAEFNAYNPARTFCDMCQIVQKA